MCENAAVMFMSSTAVLGSSLAVNLLLKPYHRGGHVVEERELNAGAEEEKEDEEFMEKGEELVYLHAEETKEGRTTTDRWQIQEEGAVVPHLAAHSVVAGANGRLGWRRSASPRSCNTLSNASCRASSRGHWI
jgi:hypothetical protein